jgi:Flp pilus assembly protein TadD
MIDSGKTFEELLAEARSLGREGKVMDAGRLLRAMAHEYSESSEVQFLLGACYAKIGREDLALISWKRSVELAPANHRAKSWLLRLEHRDPTSFEIRDEGSGAISGDLDACWDPTA